MKRILQILLAVSLVLNMAACGNTPDADAKKDDTLAAKAIVLEDTSLSQDPQNAYQMENPPAKINLAAPIPDAFTSPEALNTAKFVKKSSDKKNTSKNNKDEENQEDEKDEEDQEDEMRAVWLSYLDLQAILTGKSEKEFTKNIEQAFDNIKSLNLNTVIAQVRPFGDALYESDLFPWSYVATGTEGKDPGFDPFEIMVQIAEQKDLDIEAWINPYRVRIAGKKEAISKENPVNAMLKSGDAITYKGGTYYNPASPKARKLIADGVKEIVTNYDVDGIHFDDYFYPTTDAAFDAVDYSSYKKDGGTKSLAKWRMENVDKLVKTVYSTIKEVDDDVVFGISPQGNLNNNYETQFIDVGLWLSNPGYIDYICPQIYFGFKNAACPYAQTVKIWDDLIKTDDIKLYVGLAPYKIGTSDSWAGNGKYEWANETNMLANMVSNARDAKAYGGFILFRYESVFVPASGVKKQVATEIKNLKDILS